VTGYADIGGLSWY